MSNDIPDDIISDIQKACLLHQRATSDYEKCVEFNKLMSSLLARLEDAGLYRLADKVMTILIECNPKDGSSCEKATQVGERIKKMVTTHPKAAKIEYPDGKTYEGEIVNDLPDGEGVATFPDGGRYVGGFLQGQFHGLGQYTLPDGSSYKGAYAFGQFDGSGQLNEADGTTYTGNFSKGKRHGQGTLTLADGTRWRGTWEAGEMTGPTTLILPDGETTTGIFQNGRFTKTAGEPAAPSSNHSRS